MFSFLFAALWLRSIHGSTGRIILRTTLLAAATLGGLGLWSAVPGQSAPPAGTVVMAVVGAVPVMYLTTFVARYLVLSLFAREQAQRRDEVLAQLGNVLIGLTDRAEIDRRAGECLRELCAATPGLRMLVVPVVEAQRAGRTVTALDQHRGAQPSGERRRGTP